MSPIFVEITRIWKETIEFVDQVNKKLHDTTN